MWTVQPQASPPATPPPRPNPEVPPPGNLNNPSASDENLTNTAAILDYLRESYSHSHPPQRSLEKSAALYIPKSKISHLVGVHQHPDPSDDELWLTVDFLDLPPKPKIPTTVRAGILSADFNEKTPPSLNTTALPQEMREARAWIDTKWKEWSERTKQVESTQKLYQMT